MRRNNTSLTVLVVGKLYDRQDSFVKNFFWFLAQTNVANKLGTNVIFNSKLKNGPIINFVLFFDDSVSYIIKMKIN